jgi:hypothetical protein
MAQPGPGHPRSKVNCLAVRQPAAASSRLAPIVYFLLPVQQRQTLQLDLTGTRRELFCAQATSARL